MTIRFAAPVAGFARASVFDAAGRLVRTLHEGSLQAGRHDLAWNARDEEGRPVGAGVYLLRVSTGRDVSTGRVVIVR